MTDAHTPGPWAFGPGYTPGDSKFDLFGLGGRQVIAQASYENMWLSAYDKDTDAANARLIAAAPDLLEALQSLVANLAEGDFISETRIDAARAAIARATGEAA